MAIITLKPGSEGDDLWIANWYSYNDNFGVDNGVLDVVASRDINNALRQEYSLIRFDLAGEPTGPIQSATLRLYHIDTGAGPTDAAMLVDQLHTAWTEQYGWYDYSLSYTNFGNVSISQYGWVSIDVTAAVANWLADPSSNFGFLLRPNGESSIYGDWNYFVSSDAVGNMAAFRPELIIDYGQSNRVPVIDLSKSQVTASLNELSNTTGSQAIASANGKIAFNDPDASNRPTATLGFETVQYILADGSVATLTAGQTDYFKHAFSIQAEAGNTNSGFIDWGYATTDQNLDFLAAGEKIIVSADVVIDDGNGGVAHQAASVTLLGANDRPTAASDYTLAKNGKASGDLRANDTDPDTNDHLNVSSISFGSKTIAVSATGVTTIDGKYGTLTVDANGSYSYLAKHGGNNSQDNFVYTVNDGHGGIANATLSVDIASTDKISATGLIVKAADAFNSLLANESAWTNGKTLYDDLNAIYGSMKAVTDLSLVTNYVDQLEAHGLDSELALRLRTQADKHYLGVGMKDLAGAALLGFAVETLTDDLVEHGRITPENKLLWDALGTTAANMLSVNLGGQIVDQSVTIATQLVGLMNDTSDLVNGAIRTGFTDIAFAHTKLQPKDVDTIHTQLTGMFNFGHDLPNESWALTESGHKIELTSLLARTAFDQVRGNGLGPQDLTEAENYAVQLDKAFGYYYFPNPITGVIDKKFEHFATDLAAAYGIHDWHLS